MSLGQAVAWALFGGGMWVWGFASAIQKMHPEWLLKLNQGMQAQRGGSEGLQQRKLDIRA